MNCPRLALQIQALHKWSRHVTDSDVNRATIDHHILGCPECRTGWTATPHLARQPEDDPKDEAA